MNEEPKEQGADQEPQPKRLNVIVMIGDEKFSESGPIDACICGVLDGHNGKISTICNISNEFEPLPRILAVVEIGKACIKAATMVAQDIANKNGLTPPEAAKTSALDGVALENAPGRGHSQEN